jgi:hypothetical protein
MSDNKTTEAIAAEKISIACARMHDAIDELYENFFDEEGKVRTDSIAPSVTQLRKVMRIEIDFALTLHDEFLNERPS